MDSKSLHFLPADKESYLRKINSLPSVLIFDLEDSVSSSMKEQARTNLLALAEENSQRLKTSYVRINAFENREEFERDMLLVKELDLQRLILPKVDDPRTLELLGAEAALDECMILIESFQALRSMETYLDFDFVSSAALGIEDLLAPIPFLNANLKTLKDGVMLDFFLRVNACEKEPVATISLEFDDLESFEKECWSLRSMGYQRKMSIHPSQIEIINKVFAPTSEEVEWATRIQEISNNFEESLSYSNVNGTIVSPPKVIKAKKILRK